MKKELMSVALAASMVLSTPAAVLAEEMAEEPSVSVEVVEELPSEVTTETAAEEPIGEAEQPTEAAPEEPAEEPSQEPASEGEEENEEDRLIAAGTCGENLTWSLNGTTLTITGSGTMADLQTSLPWHAHQESIRSVIIDPGTENISSYAFQGFMNLISISIPDSVTEIGAHAFDGCSSLSGLQLSPRITKIGSYAFSGCAALQSMELPEKVMELGSYAYANCVNLYSVKLPQNITDIGSYAFSGCTNLQGIELPFRITEIREGTFAESGLTGITIPAAVGSIGANAFLNCTKLTAVNFRGSAAQWTAVKEKIDPTGNDVLLNATVYLDSTGTAGKCGDNLYWALDDGGTLVISGEGAMADFGSQDAPWMAYNADIKLVKIEKDGNGKGAANISAGAFAYCTALRRVEIADTVKVIGAGAFEHCSDLQELVLPASAASIGANAFGSTVGNVYYGGELQGWLNLLRDNADAFANGSRYVYLNGSLMADVVLPQSMGTIPANTFRNNEGLRSILLPEGLKTIGENAFLHCTNLAGISVPGTVTSIGSSAFRDCTSLQMAALYEGLQNIGSNAFQGCSTLTSLTIPANVTSIGGGAFASCQNLSAVNVANGNSIYFSDNGALYGRESGGDRLIYVPTGRQGYFETRAVTDLTGAFAGCSKLTEVKLNGSFTTVGEGTFAGCTALVKVTVPEGVSAIGVKAFHECENLNEITLPGTLTSIGTGAFAGCACMDGGIVHFGGTEDQWLALMGVSGNEVLNKSRVEYQAGKIIRVTDLVNNQCIRFTFMSDKTGMGDPAAYAVKLGDQSMAITDVTQLEAKTFQMTFQDPLKKGTYELQFTFNGTTINASFTISLDLSPVQVNDSRNLIIQLSNPIYGCTTAQNYVIHTLSGEAVGVVNAVSAYEELGGKLPNVFRLTTSSDMLIGTTYVVETRSMSLDTEGKNRCQGTISYITPDHYTAPQGNVTVVELTNNQSIVFQLPAGVEGSLIKENYKVRSSTGEEAGIGSVQDEGGNKVRINFTAPLAAGTYTLTSQNMNMELRHNFDVSLDLRILRIEKNSVIIQLSGAVFGCTDAPNYFIHKLGDSTEITAVKAESVYRELGGRYANVFRITLPEDIVAGQTYIIETRAMALDNKWERPCQGTINYFTK